jgi:hypothetical protein
MNVNLSIGICSKLVIMQSGLNVLIRVSTTAEPVGMDGKGRGGGGGGEVSVGSDVYRFTGERVGETYPPEKYNQLKQV